MPALPVRPRPPAPGLWHLPQLRLSLVRGRPYSVIPCGTTNLCSYKPRRRTVFTRGKDLRFLAGRRTLARQCRDLGFAHVGCGVWYDQVADVTYCGVLGCEDWL